jgi:hypothetical protein
MESHGLRWRMHSGVGDDVGDADYMLKGSGSMSKEEGQEERD